MGDKIPGETVDKEVGVACLNMLYFPQYATETKTMKRNKNIELLRCIAIILMLFYHYTVVIPGIMNTHFLQILDEAFCQIALLLFFTISGFGTFVYLDRQSAVPSTYEYVKKRLKKIAPQYYFCSVVILLTTGTAYLAINQIKSVAAVITFTHNLFPSTNGVINGVTWTIGLIMQFYFIAVICYRCIKRWGGIKVYLASLLLTLTVRFLISRIIYVQNLDPTLYVVFSIRQIYTTIDIFIAGMCAARCYLNGYHKLTNAQAVVSAILCGVLMILTFMVLTYAPNSQYVWGYNLRSLLWQPVLGVEVAFLCFVVSGVNCAYSSLAGRTAQVIANNEYGIYLWHMVLIANVSAGSPIYADILMKNPIVLLLLMIIAAIVVGSLSNYLFINKNI